MKNELSRALPSHLLAGAFAGLWLVIAAGGGWLFTPGQHQSAGGWAFAVYYAVMVLAVGWYLIGLYLVSTPSGRKHIRGGVWIVATFLVTLLVSYLGQFGPLKNPLLGHQADTGIMVVAAVSSFFWSVRSGGPTEELAALLAARSQTVRER